MKADLRPIGVLDSGVGGLSILREVSRLLPQEDLLYFADQGHAPYGPRQKDEIQRFVRGIVRFFLQSRVKAVVLACNAASAASLYDLRKEFFDTPFVGMEPAVKPAAGGSRSGLIGVITTRATYQGELFASVLDRFASDTEVVTQVCPDLVSLVEKGMLATEETHQTARKYLEPLLEKGIDQLVLGCTHFPLLTPVLKEIVGSRVRIIDPSVAVARQVGRVILDQQNCPDHQGNVRYFTSGDGNSLARLAAHLMPAWHGQLAAHGTQPEVIEVSWHRDRTVKMPESG